MLSKYGNLFHQKSSLRVVFALLLSLLLHVALWFKLDQIVQPSAAPMTSIDAELMLPAKSLPLLKPRPAASRKAVAKPEPVASVAPQPVEPSPVAESSQAEAAVPEAPAPPVDNAAAPSADTAVASAVADEPVAPVDEPSPSLVLPQHIEMLFDVSSGRDGGKVGVTQVSFERYTDARYKIVSTTQPQGLVALFLGNLVQRSEGIITAQGLQPVSFLYQFGDNEKREQRASFDWQAGQVQMHSKQGDVTATLIAGTQDMLSFMFQYMYVPPLEQMQVAVANGKKLSVYQYRFDGEETLNTKMGDINSLHISKSRGDSEQKLELWLAPDYYYLPVKIRKTEKDGRVYEQIVTRIAAQ